MEPLIFGEIEQAHAHGNPPPDWWTLTNGTSQVRKTNVVSMSVEPALKTRRLYAYLFGSPNVDPAANYSYLETEIILYQRGTAIMRIPNNIYFGNATTGTDAAKYPFDGNITTVLSGGAAERDSIVLNLQKPFNAANNFNGYNQENQFTILQPFNISGLTPDRIAVDFVRWQTMVGHFRVFIASIAIP